MNIIHKEILPTGNAYNHLLLPKNSKVLCFNVQRDQLVIHYEFNEADVNNKIGRSFRIICTGQEFDNSSNSLQYIGTTQLGNLVLHLYEDL